MPFISTSHGGFVSWTSVFQQCLAGTNSTLPQVLLCCKASFVSTHVSKYLRRTELFGSFEKTCRLKFWALEAHKISSTNNCFTDYLKELKSFNSSQGPLWWKIVITMYKHPHMDGERLWIESLESPFLLTGFNNTFLLEIWDMETGNHLYSPAYFGKRMI